MKAEEFDRLFDEGVDMVKYLDLSTVHHINRGRRAGADAPADTPARKPARRMVIASSAVVALGALVFAFVF